MIVSALILIISTALLLLFLQSTCQKIMRREFDRPYFQPIIEAGRLEFPEWRKLLEAEGNGMDYAGLRTALQCDLTTVRYLLKKSAGGSRGSSGKERLLLMYSHYLFLSLAVRRALGLREKPAALELAALLKYFANLVGQRVQVVSFRGLASSSVA